MTKSADLHIHTTYSDSTLSPRQVVEDAIRAGLDCIAVTDHDVIDGITPVREEAHVYGLEVISGIELSSQMNGTEVHVLGYCMDITNSHLLERLHQMQDARVERMKKMMAKLAALGVQNVTFEEAAAFSETKALGRPHLAMILKEKGIVPTVKEAFDRYLAEGAPAYVPKLEQTPHEAIRLIRDAGGIAVLAHPMLTRVNKWIPDFIRDGLGGLEVYYPNTREDVMRFYEDMAKKHGLVVTGGSDAHGESKKHTFIGKVRIPYNLVEDLKEAAHR